MGPAGSQIAQNIPNNSLMYSSFTPTFGNIMFAPVPSQTGPVNFSFGQFPTVSLEGLLFQQQMTAPVQPSTIAPGQNAGQQNISGQYTVTGPAGNQQVAIGNASTTSGQF